MLHAPPLVMKNSITFIFSRDSKRSPHSCARLPGTTLIIKSVWLTCWMPGGVGGGRVMATGSQLNKQRYGLVSSFPSSCSWQSFITKLFNKPFLFSPLSLTLRFSPFLSFVLCRVEPSSPKSLKIEKKSGCYSNMIFIEIWLDGGTM